MVSEAAAVLAKAKRHDLGDGWFDVIELPGDLYALAESGHIQEVCSFLVIGSEKALLFDTGMGIDDISKVVCELTNQEIVVVNSHTHFDHIGDNWRFPTIHVYADDYAVDVLTEGFSHREVRYDSEPELFTKEYPPGFEPEQYFIRSIEKDNIHLLHDGDTIALGDRQLEVLHTPGHSQDGIMLLDRANRILLTGDTYCEWIFAFFDAQMPKYGYSALKDYAQTLKDVSRLVPDLDYLCPSHGAPLADPGILVKVAQALEQILRGDADYYHEALYGADRRVYTFDGFLIWT